MSARTDDIDEAPVLVVAATAMELAPLLETLAAPTSADGRWSERHHGRVGALPVALAACGIGKVNAAAGTMAHLLETRARAVVQVGIGGAYLGSFLSNGLVAAASEELQLDLGLRHADGRVEGLAALGFPATPALAGRPERDERVPTHDGLQQALREACGLPTLRFATLDAVTGDVDAGAALQRAFDVSVESMEGAAVAQLCDRLGVPFAELRGVSNLVGHRDKRLWDVRGAVRASCAAARTLLSSWREHPATQSIRGSAVPGADC